MESQNQEYLLKKRKSNSPEDLTAQFVFELLQLQKTNNAQSIEEFKREILRNQKYQSIEQNSGLQREEITKVLKKIDKTILEKDIDIEPVLMALGHIYKEYPKILSGLDEIAQRIKENKPVAPKEISFSEVIKSQNKGSESIRNSISNLANIIKGKKYPDKFELSNPVEIVKPSWWKEFSFSWEPLKELVEKVKAHTFSVKVINQEKRDELDIDKLAKKIGKEVEEAVKKIPRSGGMGNPFKFDESTGGLIISGGESGGGYEVVGVKDMADARINPMSEEKGEEIVQAIDNITIPSPVGGATESKQDSQILILNTIEGNQLPNNHDVFVSNFPATQPISASALPLPSGASTAGKQDDIIAAINNTVVSVSAKTTALASSGNVHTPASGKKTRIYNLKFSLSADITDVSFRWGAGGTDFAKFLNPKSGGFYGTNLHSDYIEGATDAILYCVINGTGTVQINLEYKEI